MKRGLISNFLGIHCLLVGCSILVASSDQLYELGNAGYQKS